MPKATTKKPKSIKPVDIARGHISEIVFRVAEAMNFGADKDDTLREVQRLAGSALHNLCPKEKKRVRRK